MTAGPKTWLQRHGLAYALLRLQADLRPGWARALGLRAYLLNGAESPELPPRLRFKRRLGSHAGHPRADPDYVQAEEARYEAYLRQLLESLPPDG